MTTALLRAGLSTRAMLVFATAFCCGIVRAMGVVANEAATWTASPLHEIATAVALGLLVPTFTILLGGMLLRGEHAPWSWSLARPVARTRVLATSMAADVITIGACIGVAALAFQGFDRTFWPDVDFVERVALTAFAYAVLYAATAVGSARGMTSLRAGAFAVAWLGILAFLGTKIARPSFFEFDPFHVQHRWYAARPLPHGLSYRIGIVLAIAMVLVAVTLAFHRAVKSVPAAPRWRALLVPSVDAFVICLAAAVAIRCIIHFVPW